MRSSTIVVSAPARDAMAEKLGAVAETLPFDEIHVIDHRKTPPRILKLK